VLHCTSQCALIPASPQLEAVKAQRDQRTLMDLPEPSDVSGCPDDGIDEDSLIHTCRSGHGMARASLDYGVLRLRYIDWAAAVVEMTCKMAWGG
jgi:hypothetical protein